VVHVEVDLNCPIFQKYADKFNIDEYLEGGRHALLAAQIAAGSDDFVQFCNGFVILSFCGMMEANL
jgi:hypothetical protein